MVLALTVWCAYVCDRVLDARVLDARGGAASSSRLAQLALRERHFFHWRHRRWMTPLAAAAAIAAATFALALMPSFVRNRGAVLAGATLVYLSGIHALPPRRRGRCLLPSPVRKELLVGVLFTAGCVLPAWAGLDHSRTTEISNQWFWIPAVYFAGLAWLNCWCIARWESPGKTGTVRARHSRRTERFFGRAEQGANADVPLMFAFAGLLLGAAASASQPRAAALILAGAASALLLALLDRARLRLAPLALRAAADFVLLTPLLLIL